MQNQDNNFKFGRYDAKFPSYSLSGFPQCHTTYKLLEQNKRDFRSFSK